MKFIIIAAVILSASFAFGDQRQLASTASQSLTKKATLLLTSDNLPDFNFKDASAEDVIHFLQKNHEKSGPTSGISYVLISPISHTLPHFTGSLKGLNASQALNALCSQIDLYWWIDPSAVVIAPKSNHKAEQGAAANP